MARKLARTVTVDGQTYPAGSTPPAKVADKIRTRSAWGPDEADTSDETPQDPGNDQGSGDGGNENTDQTQGNDESPSNESGDGDDAGDEGEDDAETSDSDPLEEPPRRGRGATDAAWRKHAQALGVEVDTDAGRDDVQAVLVERGLIDPS